jgi:hypothetical protein
MATLILGFLIIGLAVCGLAVGVIAGRAPLKGSCGGLACGGACAACPRRKD